MATAPRNLCMYYVHMALTRRTQVLLDDDRYEAIRRRAESEGISVGAMIRKAIDQAVSEGEQEREARRAAGASFLAAEPMEVDDWPAMKAEIEGSYLRDLAEDDADALRG